MKSNFLSLLLLICNISFLVGCQATHKGASIASSEINRTATVPSPSAPPPIPKGSIPVGINLGGITYYSTDYPFLNAFKNASSWRTVCIKTDPGCIKNQFTREENLLKLDRNGWIESLPSPQDSAVYTRARSYLFSWGENQYLGGQYIVSYKGEGKLSYGGVAKVIESQPGRDIININLNNRGKVWLDLVSTDPKNNGNYLRDIVIVKAKDKNKLDSQIFNPDFTSKLQGFKVIRFMDWMSTNKSQQKSWNQRPLVTNATYSQGNIPIEVMVALCNQLNVSPWFNIPHMADDEYVRNFAALVKRTLKPGLKIYLEYSNEVWNRQFPQAKWVQEQAVKLWPAPQYPQDPWTKQLNWHGQRTAEVCQIWKEVFAKKSQSVVCVLASQMASDWSLKQSLDCPLSVTKPCYKQKIDALGVGAYFGGYLFNRKIGLVTRDWSLDRLFKELTVGGELENGQSISSLKKTQVAVRNAFQLARARNLQLFAYEGGQHMTISGRNEPNLLNLLTGANRDERIYQAYISHLNNWKNEGGSLFMHFSYISPPSKWGMWGLLESVDENSSPKYRAVKDFIRDNP